MVSTETIEKLSAYLLEDEERAKNLMHMPADEAVAKMNADGYDFSEEDLQEFARLAAEHEAASKSGAELDEAALENVSGGILFSSLCAAGFCFVCVACGCQTLLNYWNSKAKKK